MRRGLVITLLGMGAGLGVLAVALATTGTDLDELRLERESLQGDLDVLQQELRGLMQERNELQQQVQEQVGTIAQSQAELQRLRELQTSAEAVPAPALDAAPATAE